MSETTWKEPMGWKVPEPWERETAEIDLESEIVAATMKLLEEEG